jgi:hypothetical protein
MSAYTPAEYRLFGFLETQLTKTRLKICFILKMLNVPDGKDKHLKSEIDIVEWNLVLARIGGHKDMVGKLLKAKNG